MGVFVGFVSSNANIPDEKKKSFVNGVLEVFREGGMFSRSCTLIHDNDVWTLEWPAIGKDGCCDVTYSWFENSGWENAGLDLFRGSSPWSVFDGDEEFDPYIYSNKVGSSSFSDVIQAAYTLQMLFLDGPSAFFVEDKEPEVPIEYAQWIAGILPDVDTSFFPDLWRSFAALVLRVQ